MKGLTPSSSSPKKRTITMNIHMNKKFLFNPFASGDFAEKRVLKLVKWFSGHCRAIKS